MGFGEGRIRRKEKKKNPQSKTSSFLLYNVWNMCYEGRLRGGVVILSYFKEGWRIGGKAQPY
jgi:hypothetical protein